LIEVQDTEPLTNNTYKHNIRNEAKRLYPVTQAIVCTLIDTQKGD